MAKDWRLLAKASGFEIPPECLDRIAPVLDALEAAFRPLTAAIPPEVEPAVLMFRAREENQ